LLANESTIIFCCLIYVVGQEHHGGKLDYMHKNRVSKKGQLVNDFTDYLYSSASYCEKGIKQYDKLLYVNEVLL